MTGKEKCEKLKEIRKFLADFNGLEYNPSVCTFEGDCTGTCPKCEEELKALSDELLRRVEEEGYHIKGFDVICQVINDDISDDEIFPSWKRDKNKIACSSCGTKLSPHARFCTNCGQKVPRTSIVKPKKPKKPEKMIMGQMRNPDFSGISSLNIDKKD